MENLQKLSSIIEDRQVSKPHIDAISPNDSMSLSKETERRSK
jgi:hypothetical protein